jgi:diguanylate cyclase (GGDEF)-like protein
MKPRRLLLLTIFWSVLAQATPHTATLARMEAAVVDNDADTAQKLWKELTPHLDGLSPADQGRFLVVQGLIQEDVLGDLLSADDSFNRVISLLDGAPVPTQALADAYYERAYIKYIRTNNTAVYCPDREKAVEITRELDTRAKLPRYLTSLSICYTDSPQRLQQGMAVLNEAMTLAQTMQLGPSDRGFIFNATALLYRKSQLFAQAHEYSKLAYKEYAKTPDNASSLNTQLHNLLTNAIGMGDLEQAELHGKEMFALADAHPEHKDFRFFAALDSGLVALARDDLPRAIRLFEQARGEERNTEEGAFIAGNRAALAGAYLANGNIDAALREAAAVSRMPGYASLDADQKRVVQALQEYAGHRPVQALQTLLALYRGQQKKQWDFLANTTLEHAQRHNERIRTYETQLLENKVQIQQLKLDAQRRQQEATRLYLILAAVAAVSLGLLAWILWRSRLRFRSQAQTDSLTGIANRRHFLDRAQEVASSSRQQSQVASVMVLDIDYFKLINDAHGHQAGDAAIRHVALQASNCLREGDVIGRLGGEEFAILLPATDERTAWSMAERLRKVIEQTPLEHHGERIPITVSIGLMSGTLTADNIETMIQCADKVMYRAKNTGRNRSLAHADQFPEAAALSAVG